MIARRILLTISCVAMAISGCTDGQTRIVTSEIVARENLYPKEQCDVSRYASPIDQAAKTFSRGIYREYALKDFPVLARSFFTLEPPARPCRIEIHIPQDHWIGLMPNGAANAVTVIIERELICLNFRNWAGQINDSSEFPSGVIRNPRIGDFPSTSKSSTPRELRPFLPACYDQDGNFKSFRKAL